MKIQPQHFSCIAFFSQQGTERGQRTAQHTLEKDFRFHLNYMSRELRKNKPAYAQNLEHIAEIKKEFPNVKVTEIYENIWEVRRILK